ncbi:UDP-N-acetylglucosamine acetyltransferase [uncultured delta proteobacterium]|uniref:Acyl-[acyl-carrier-protein]--UDP-N-acetylglucosamine O-acyltransferase n=1 Tax=uncultured delta proteobacterium TaxID=34034 RepID=A0A212JWE5_9DELT|nr:UDP-N-acetylglucosamine acetyltransferase [uncultured delta proteobacterium]
MATNIHPTALVSPKAELGENVSIGHCAVVEANVVIGDHSSVEPFASVKAYTRMGRNNTIHSYAMVGGIPQDLKFHGEESWLEMGDNNHVREFATLHRGTEGGGGVTRIGSNNLFMAYIHIAHDCQLGDRIIMSNAATLAGHVIVEDGAILGGLCAVHQFCRIGTHAFVGGMTGVGMDTPPYMLASGHRGELHGPNLVGLRRMQVSRETLAAVRSAYRTIWLSGIPRQEALEQVEKDHASVPEVLRIVAFIRASERGVLAASSKEGNAE